MSEHTTVLPERPSGPAPRRSLGLVAVVASVVVVVLVMAGGFAAWRWFSGGGPRPADVLPASTFALLSLDLDPSGGQKVEAIKTLRNFPGFRDQIGLKPGSDPLERLFGAMQNHGTCKGLDYERDVKSWIGQRLGVGGVELDGKPRPVAALQVSDADAAKAGFARLAKCADLTGFGWTLSDGYIVVSDTTAHAEQVAAAGRKTPLSEDDTFQRWTDEAGGAGIMNAYVAPEAVDLLSEELGSGLTDLGGLGDSGATGSKEEQHRLADLLAGYQDFRGAGAVLHFADGGVELAVAGGAARAARTKTTVAEHVAAMPADTALLLAVAVPPQAFTALGDADPSGSGSQLLGSMLGLDFPRDLQTLLGHSLSLSVGGRAPVDLSSVNEPSDVSVGALIHGDSAGIDRVIAKLEKTAGVSLAELRVVKKSEDGKVVLASNADYADRLLGTGSLSHGPSFRDAVPHADHAQVVAYVDFDGSWGQAVLTSLREDGSPESRELAENLAPLRALGLSAWTDGDVSHGLVRLSLK